MGCCCLRYSGFYCGPDFRIGLVHSGHKLHTSPVILVIIRIMRTSILVIICYSTTTRIFLRLGTSLRGVIL